jgi:hypothetical protein
MVQTLIIGFLIGAAISSAFRVWAMIPLTLVIFLGATFYHLYEGQRAFPAIGDGFLTALVPQAGYAFGITLAGILLAMRSPRKLPLNRFKAGNPPSGA